MSKGLERKEIMEAIWAGEAALISLTEAGERLGSARNWGIFDMLGGGFITDFVKHSRMNDAARCMEEARRNLRIFQRELKDIQVSMEFSIEVNGFLSFADFFFDGLVADYLVQTKINEAREQVEDAIMHVSRLLEKLKTIHE